MTAPICPNCKKELPGLGTFCHDCGDYVEDMAPEAGVAVSPVPEVIPDERLEDERRMAVRQTLDAFPGTAKWPHGFVVLDFEQSRKGTRVRLGLADLYIMGFGVSAWVEMKTDKGTQSDDQKDFQADCVACGVPYYVWRNEEHAQEWATRMREGS